jgi:hypothetical protein
LFFLGDINYGTANPLLDLSEGDKLKGIAGNSGKQCGLLYVLGR